MTTLRLVSVHGDSHDVEIEYAKIADVSIVQAGDKFFTYNGMRNGCISFGEVKPPYVLDSGEVTQ